MFQIRKKGKKMVLSKENFSYLDLPDLLLNIWDYGHCPKNDEIIKRYMEWNIFFAEKKWKPEYFDFEDTVFKIATNNEKCFDLSQF